MIIMIAITKEVINMQKQGDTKVDLRKSKKQQESREAKTLLKKNKKIIRTCLLASLFLFILVSLIIVGSGGSISDYNQFLDYIFKLITLFLNVL